MWGCDFTPYATGWGSWFPMVFWLLILGGIALLALKGLSGKTRNGNQDADRNDSLEILKKRLARGEINVDEYNTLKSVL